MMSRGVGFAGYNCVDRECAECLRYGKSILVAYEPAVVLSYRFESRHLTGTHKGYINLKPPSS